MLSGRHNVYLMSSVLPHKRHELHMNTRGQQEVCLTQYFVSSTACLMLVAREMKGENGSSALTVRLSAAFFLFVLKKNNKKTHCTSSMYNQHHILFLLDLTCLKVFLSTLVSHHFFILGFSKLSGTVFIKLLRITFKTSLKYQLISCV